ncbi:MAG: OmpA family protein [Bacteroidota bacterium]
MNNILKHILSCLLIVGALFVPAMRSYAQTPTGTRIDNVATARFEYLNGSQGIVRSDTARITVEGWGSLFLNKTVAQTNLSVGDTVQFKIVVGYSGNLSASQVVVSDTVPSHFSVISSTKGFVSGNIVTWNVGTVSPSSPDTMLITVFVKNIPNGTYTVTNNAFATDSTGVVITSSATTLISAARNPDVDLKKNVLADSVRLGGVLPYVISAKNSGNVALQNVTLTDTLPTALDFISVDDQRIVFSNGILSLNLADMKQGDSLSFTMQTRLARIPATERIITNTVYLMAEIPTDSLTVNAVQSVSTILIGRAAAASAVIVSNPSMTITKTASKDSVTTNDTLNYRMVMKNNGDVALTGITMTDTVDATYFTVMATSNITSVQNNVLTLTKDTLAVGDSIVASVRVHVDKKSVAGYTNSAFARSSTTPTISATAFTPFKETINPLANNLLLKKFASKDTVVNGDSVKYVIQFTNNGPLNLTNVIITDTLPTQLTKNVILYSKGILINNFVYYNAGSLTVGQTDSIVIVSVMNASPYVSEQVTNTAHASATEVPMVSSQVTVISRTGNLEKLLLTKTASASKVFAGDSLSYVVRVTNISNKKLTNLIIRDPLPFQVENIRIEQPGTVQPRSGKLSIVSLTASGMTFLDSLRLEGSVVVFTMDTINAGEQDSFYVKTTVRQDRPNLEVILNTAYAATDQTSEIIAQAVTEVKPKTETEFKLELKKSVSKNIVYIGDTLSYYIRVKNISTEQLTGITVVDTLPAHIINPQVIGKGKVNGNVVTYNRDALAAGESDSITIIGQLNPYQVHDGELVLNYAFANTSQTGQQTAYALFTAKTDPACRIVMKATPDKIIGNGKSKAYIEVYLSNTLGYPKPDGSPVTLSTTVGEFSNGQKMRVLYSKDGKVSDSLRATVAGNNLVNAMAIAEADDGQGCSAKDTVNILFYPGAIEGTVIDHRTSLPVSGAVVRAYSKTTDSLAGMQVTKEDGYYLIPVAKTDSFRVMITTVNEFGKEVTVNTELTVNVSGNGDLPTPNQNSVSGAVYYLISHQPVAAQKITVLLQSISGAAELLSRGMYKADASPYTLTTIDSTYTDSTGTFQFDYIPEGQFLISLAHSTLTGSVLVQNPANGRYIINANIAITLNPNIVFEKTGPSRVTLVDTAQYNITLKNTGTLSATNVVITDSLHPVMKFVSATGGGIYNFAQHRIVWNIAQLDSFSERVFAVKVRFADTLQNTMEAMNRASVTSDQTTMIKDSVNTTVALPPVMRIWKVSDVHTAQPGDSVRYTIKVRNISGSFADSVAVTDKLPTQIDFLRGSAAYYRGGAVGMQIDSVLYSSALHSITWKRDTLFVGDSVVISLITRVRTTLEPGDHQYTNVAAASWNGGSVTSDLDSMSDATVRSSVSYLRISKQAVRKVLEIGDIAAYVVRVTNTSASNYAYNIQVADRIPFGFAYVKGSTFIDTAKIADPAGKKELMWALNDSLAPGASIQFSYRLIVGAGGVEGNGINTAQAFGVSQFGNPMASALVQERVDVRRGVFTTHGVIIGKVFYDDNRNRYQDDGEVGVKGIELMMEDGTRVITGDDGKYSLPDVLPGEHVVRVRTHTLPKHTHLEMGYNDFAGDSTSRFVRLTESGIARVDFYLERNIVQPDSLLLDHSIVKVGNFTIQRIASPRNIVFIEDQRFASMKLTGLNFEVGKAVLRPEAYVTLRQLADILREYPDQPLIVAGHTDSMKIATEEFPNNKVLSMARAMAVKTYLVDKEGINASRIRVEGHGETRPLATNKTIDGRSLNRRVEFFFTPSTEQKPVLEMPVAFEIPIEYSGTSNVSKIELIDRLDEGFRYVDGSATFADSSIAPTINGNELRWNIENPGSNFKYKLRYTVMVKRPSQYGPLPVRSFTSSIRYVVGSDTLHSLDTLLTTNEIAIAIRGRAVNFVMNGVLFDVGKATLRSTALSSLETTAKFLKEDPGATAMIEGHTDSSPISTKEFPSNKELSEARANTIKNALVQNFGIAAERLKSVGFGEFRPLASNHTPEGRQVNRRIEMRILRNEFVQNVLPEGKNDSSKIAIRTHLPELMPKKFDSLVTAESKERYIIRIDIRRIAKKNTIATTVIDTIPSEFSLIKESVVRLKGIDSIMVKGNVIIAHCSQSDSTFSFAYLVDVNHYTTDETVINNSYTVRKKQQDETIIDEVAKSVPVEVRKRRILVRNQR